MNILNKLTIKHLKMNKKRTIVSIIGIILSTALMVGIGLLLSTFREVLMDNVINNKGNYHASFKDVSPNKLELISNNAQIDNVYYKQDMGFSLINNISESNNNYKLYYHLYGLDKEYFNQLNLIEGRIPVKDNEIVISNSINNNDTNFKVGDKIKLTLGNRYYNNELYLKDEYIDNEYLGDLKETKEYVIVGIVNKDVREIYSTPGYSIFTIQNQNCSNEFIVYTTFKNPSKTYDISKGIALNLGYVPLNEYDSSFSEIDYNASLLSLYGVTNYDNLYASMIGMLSIMLGLVSIGCIIVIYNSFAISVMERKKQFGLFSSIGATKHQIRKTVIFEAIIVSLIGIPIGILSAYLGIGVVIMIMNNLISEMVETNMRLCTYPLFLIVPIIFMLLTIFISAIIPALKASKISPIEAIRLNDDIRIKGKKVKSPKLIRKMFGIEGDIAYKNIKRNKKKYRITVASLFISIVLFISFSGYMNYALQGSEEYIGSYDFDALLYQYDKKEDNIVDMIVKNEYVEDCILYKELYFDTKDTNFSLMYTDSFKKLLNDNNIEDHNGITFIIIDDEHFNDYLKSMNKTVVKPILYNKYNNIIYKGNSRRVYDIKKYKTGLKDIIKINLQVVKWDEEKYKEDNNYDGDYIDAGSINDYYISSKEFMGSSEIHNVEHATLIISEALINKYNLTSYTEDLHDNAIIKTSDNDKFDDYMMKLKNDDKLDNMYYYNITKGTEYTNNIIFVIKLLVYGFIVLVTLIGITSVFNTINTSIALRRKEFAVLRSIGLSPKGFKKMLIFESIFFGLKALLYALPVSFLVIFVISMSMDNIVSLGYIIIPWKSIIFAIIGVFIVVAISMMYATSKIKKENILDAIRQENI